MSHEKSIPPCTHKYPGNIILFEVRILSKYQNNNVILTGEEKKIYSAQSCPKQHSVKRCLKRGSICNENAFITRSTNAVGCFAVHQTKDLCLAVLMVHKPSFYLSKSNRLQTFKKAHSCTLYISSPKRKEMFKQR